MLSSRIIESGAEREQFLLEDSRLPKIVTG
jgi:hypothetical protein